MKKSTGFEEELLKEFVKDVWSGATPLYSGGHRRRLRVSRWIYPVAALAGVFAFLLFLFSGGFLSSWLSRSSSAEIDPDNYYRVAIVGLDRLFEDDPVNSLVLSSDNNSVYDPFYFYEEHEENEENSSQELDWLDSML